MAKSDTSESSTPDSAAEPAASTALTYEQSRDELLDVVQKLEAGGAGLEESLALWERGEQLAGICQQWLDRASQKLASAVQEGSAEPESQ